MKKTMLLILLLAAGCEPSVQENTYNDRPVLTISDGNRDVYLQIVTLQGHEFAVASSSTGLSICQVNTNSGQ